MRNNSPDGLTNPSSDRLARLGLGLRCLRGFFSASLDYGRLVVGSKVPLSLNSGSPQKDEDRLYVNLAVRF